MRCRKLLFSLFIFALAGVWAVPAQINAQSQKVVTLAGYKLTPSTPSSGVGTLTLTLKNDTLTVKGSFSGLVAPYTGGGIYFSQKKRAVNRLFTLQAELNNDDTGGKFKAADNRFHLSEAHKELWKNGELAIIITSSKFNRGEIGVDIPGSS